MLAGSSVERSARSKVGTAAAAGDADGVGRPVLAGAGVPALPVAGSPPGEVTPPERAPPIRASVASATAAEAMMSARCRRAGRDPPDRRSSDMLPAYARALSAPRPCPDPRRGAD